MKNSLSLVVLFAALVGCSSGNSDYVEIGREIKEASSLQARDFISNSIKCSAMARIMFREYKDESFKEPLIHYTRLAHMGVVARHSDLPVDVIEKIACKVSRYATGIRYNADELCGSENMDPKYVSAYKSALDRNFDLYLNHNLSEVKAMDDMISLSSDPDARKRYVLEFYASRCDFY